MGGGWYCTAGYVTLLSSFFQLEIMANFARKLRNGQWLVIEITPKVTTNC